MVRFLRRRGRVCQGRLWLGAIGRAAAVALRRALAVDHRQPGMAVRCTAIGSSENNVLLAVGGELVVGRRSLDHFVACLAPVPVHFSWYVVLVRLVL